MSLQQAWMRGDACMSGNDLSQELFATAGSDLKAIENMLDVDAFDDRIFGFHAQQAVEKALKAWLNCLQGTHPFTHDLSLLLHALEESGQDVTACWDLLDLSGYAVRFRYETLPEGEEPLDRRELLRNVRALVERVQNVLASQ